MIRVAAVAVLVTVTGCATAPRPTVLKGVGLGAEWTVKIAGDVPPDLGSVRRGIQAQVDSVGHQLSRWVPDSSLNVMNASPSGEWQVVPPELFASLTYAFSLARDTDGAFDPTVAALVDVWGFGTAGRIFSPPSAEAVSTARERVGYGKVALAVDGQRVRKPAGLQIDLSSMQHGTGADAVGRYLESIGVTRYLVDVGSEIRARGESPEGGAWHVAIERPPEELSDPPADEAPTLHIVNLRDAGIATSGNYRYYFDYNGRRYSHRIDPRTGEPVAHTLAAVTVIDPECAHADALATALTVLGPVDGLKFATERNIAALFIERSGNGLVEHMTPQFAAYVGRAP